MRKLLLLLLLIPNLLMAASFDCAKASTKHEKMICDNPELNKADEEMGDMYFFSLKTFKEDAKEIKIAQKEFNKKYRKCKVLDKCLSVIKQRIGELSLRLGGGLTQDFILQKFPICQIKWMGFMQFCKGQPKDRSLNDIDLSFKTESKSDATTSFTHNDGKSYYSFTVEKNQITLTSQALDGGTYLASTTYHLKNDDGKWSIIGEEGITYTPKETHPYAAYKTPISFLGDEVMGEISERLQECFDKADGKETSVIGYTNDVKDCEIDEHTYEDRRLNINYKKLISLLSDEKKILLRNKQREWIKYRDKEALSMTSWNHETGEVVDKIYYSSWVEMSREAGKMGELSYQSTMRKLTKKRADELADMLIKFACSDSSSIWHNCVGTYTYANGNQYVGEYRDGKANGHGTYTYADGEQYVGEFRDKKRHGHGMNTLPDGTQHVGAWRDDKRHGHGTMTLPDGTQYVGAWRDDKPHGQGTETFADGTTYVGEYKDGKKNGQGTMTSLDGKKYVGEHKDSFPNGQGTMTWSDGTTYVGEFVNGKYHGQGTMTWPNGEQYVGEYKDNKRNGHGTMTSLDGEKYVGAFKDDKFHGQGTETFADGTTYVGEFKDSVPNGQGTMTSPNGTTYVGEFKDGKKNGHGTMTSPNGTNYVGEFKDGEKNGHGTMTSSGGQKYYVGEWKKDKPHGQGTETFADGTTYVGEFKDSVLHGQGTMTWSDGKKYVGEFKDGERNGHGTMTSLDGQKYVGEWKKDKLHGQGTMTWPNGEQYVGEYKDNKRNGHGTMTSLDGTTYVGEFKDGENNGHGIMTKETLISNNSFLTNDQKIDFKKRYLNNENVTLTEINENIGAISINAILLTSRSNDWGILYIKHGEKILRHIDCDLGCNLMVASSDKPLIAVYDGAVIPHGKGARMDGRWVESKHIHNISTIKKIPVFKASNLSRKKNAEENRYVGFVINSYGNRWGGAKLILVDVDTGTLITKDSRDESYPNFVFLNGNQIIQKKEDAAPVPKKEAPSAQIKIYKNKLRNAINKHINYPKMAQKRNLQGNVILVIEVDGQGNLIKHKIVQRSGYSILDKAAMNAVKRASPFPKPPKELESRNFNVTVPINFSLSNKDEEKGIFDWLF